MTKYRVISILVSIVILFVSVMIYMISYKKSVSFSTPTAALKHVQNPKLKVGEIIDIEKLNSYNETFIFFHSNFPSNINHSSIDYLGVAKLKKGKFGWRFIKIYGEGPITKANANGDYTGNKDLFVGFVTSNISKVKLGDTTAKLIPLKNENFKIWVIFNPEIQNSEQVQFIK